MLVVVDMKHLPKSLLAQNIARLRGACGWTQSDLEKRCGVKVHMIEAGKRWPREETVSAIAEALGVSVADLYAENLEDRAS